MMKAHRTRNAASLALVAGVAVTVSSGCGDEAITNPAAQNLAYPADVARVIEESCASCHAATPQFGAPMSLMTWADTQRPAVTDPARRVWELMGERVHDVARPMPPTRLDAPAMAVIDAWVRARAPGCAGAACAQVRPVDGNTVPLPCTPSHAFAAHARGAQGPYVVGASAGNRNVCFAFRSPFTAATQATAFGPRVNNASVLHHMILFATDTAQTEGAVFDCDGNMPRDARFVAGWAPGSRGTIAPADVGIELPGPSSWFILQVHYWNLQPHEAPDASGIQLCTTTELRPHTAAVSTLGSLNISIPPRATDHAVIGRCTPAATEPIHVIGSGPHMHRNGASLRTEVLRGGSEAAREMMVDVPSFSFDAQRNYPSDLVVMPGDVIQTTCRFRNPTTETVYFGERTEDEMCFNFVLAWPAGALANAGGAGARRCIDRAQ